MRTLKIQLFGRFRTQWEAQPLPGLETRKVQELLSFLLLNRERPHPRESLAALLWQSGTTSQQRGYLRKALWQLQEALPTHRGATVTDEHLLEVETDWVRLHLSDDVWLDTDAFETAFELTKGLPGHQLDSRQFREVREATELYEGDLLEGWYQDWCLYERERLQHLYLAMLDKLMDFHAARGEVEQGVACGFRILHHDLAHERTHRKLMRLFHLAGNRTEALRQYRRCRQVLREELEVEPSHRTETLYRLICSDQVEPEAADDAPGTDRSLRTELLAPRQSLTRLEAIPPLLEELQQRLRQEIASLREALRPSDREDDDPATTRIARR